MVSRTLVFLSALATFPIPSVHPSTGFFPVAKRPKDRVESKCHGYGNQRVFVGLLCSVGYAVHYEHYYKQTEQHLLHNVISFHDRPYLSPSAIQQSLFTLLAMYLGLLLRPLVVLGISPAFSWRPIAYCGLRITTWHYWRWTEILNHIVPFQKAAAKLRRALRRSIISFAS